MPRSRWGSVGLVVLAVVIALLAAVGGVVAVSRTVASDVPGADGRRRLGDSGIRVAVPTGWIDHRRAREGALLLEVEHRPIAGLIATRGMWVGRWNADGAPVEGWDEGPPISGFASRHRTERIGPPAIVGRLPGGVTLHRSIFQVVAFERVYEVGFWGPQPTLGDEVERAVLAQVSIEQPPPIELALDGVSVTVPAAWNRGDCDDARPATTHCAFSPSTSDRRNDSWVYVFPWKADSLEAATQQLLASLSKQETVGELVSEPAELGGRPAARVRFAFDTEDTGPAHVEELIIPGRSGFVLIALGWRTPEGRVQLDSVMQTLRL